jgi:hypothetical protein
MPSSNSQLAEAGCASAPNKSAENVTEYATDFSIVFSKLIEMAGLSGSTEAAKGTTRGDVVAAGTDRTGNLALTNRPAAPIADCKIGKSPLYTRHSRFSLPCRLADLSH